MYCPFCTRHGPFSAPQLGHLISCTDGIRPLPFTRSFYQNCSNKIRLEQNRFSSLVHARIIPFRLLFAHGIRRGFMPRGICKLCLNEDDLVMTHLIPAAVFKSLRSEGQDATSVTATRRLQISRQFQAPLLCATCEDRLNKGGETWVLARMARQIPRARFPLFEIG